MSLIQSLLTHVPTWLLCFAMIAIYVTIAAAGLLIVRKFYPHNKCKLHNDIGGFIFATLGVIYAVLLAFTVVITWQDFDKAQDITVNEAKCIGSLYSYSASFPSGFQAKLKSELTGYAKAIISEEWPVMARGQGSANVQKIRDRLWKLYSGFRPANETQKILLTASVEQMTRASELRGQRIFYAGQGTHPLLYFILIIGSLITIAFTLLFGTENIIPHLIMTSLLGMMIAITLFTVIAMDYPFTGDISIKPEVFRAMLADLPI